MDKDYAALWRDYFAITGALMHLHKLTGQSDPELYEALHRLREAALVGEVESANIGSAA